MSNSLSPPFFLNSTHSPQLHPVTGEQLAGVSRDGRAPPPPSGLSPQASTRSAHRTPRLPPAPAERENSLSPAEPPPSRACSAAARGIPVRIGRAPRSAIPPGATPARAVPTHAPRNVRHAGARSGEAVAGVDRTQDGSANSGNAGKKVHAQGTTEEER